MKNLVIPDGYYQLPAGSDFLEGDKFWSDNKWCDSINYVRGKTEGWKVEKNGMIYIRKSPDQVEQVEINGKNFELNITRAKELGVLVEPTVLTAGDKYEYVSSGQIVYPIESWDGKWYLGGLNGNPFKLFSSTYGISKEQMITALKEYKKI